MISKCNGELDKFNGRRHEDTFPHSTGDYVAKGVKPHKGGDMTGHLKCDSSESSGAVVDRESGGAHHADFSVSTAIQLLRLCLD